VLPVLLFGGALAIAGGIAALSMNHHRDSHSERTPSIASTPVFDCVGSKPGPVGSGTVTDTSMPTMCGTGQPGHTVTIRDGDVVLGTTLVDEHGNWTFTPRSPLSDGEHCLTATQIGPDTRESEPTKAVTIVVDTAPHNPADGNTHASCTPVIVSVTDDVGAVRGALSNGAITDDSKPTLTGTADPGSKVTVYDNGAALGSAIADAAGRWSCTPATPLAEGSHRLTAKAADAAGNVSGASTAFGLTMRYTSDNAQDQQGSTPGTDSSSGNTTDVPKPDTTASLHVRIVDTNGINSFRGNTVELVNSKGVVVATQVINPQSGSQTNGNTGLVDFYGLDPKDTYSVVLLSNVNGLSSDIGGVLSATTGVNGAGTLNIIENVNATWSGLTTGDANHAYVLTAASGTASVFAYTGRPGGGCDIAGTSYNDTFFAQAGSAVCDGAGGTDIVDFKLAGNLALLIDLGSSAAQFTSYNTVAFRNMEGVAGANGNDWITNGKGDNVFEGRGGNDYFNLVHSGHDTLLYRVLKASDATGGNGTDTVDHFTVGKWETAQNATRLDLTSLLTGYTPGAGAKYVNGVATIDASDHIADYVKATVANGNTTLWVDRDGTGSQFSPAPLIVLNGVQSDLATLLANHQII
jgi:hypothetical protein